MNINDTSFTLDADNFLKVYSKIGVFCFSVTAFKPFTTKFSPCEAQ